MFAVRSPATDLTSTPDHASAMPGAAPQSNQTPQAGHQPAAPVDSYVFTLLAPFIVAPDDRKAARLACSCLRAALDADPATAFTAMRIASWELAQLLRPLSPALQQSVTHLDVVMKGAADWQQLARFARASRLHSVRCFGRRTWFNWTTHEALPSVRAVSVVGSVESVARLAAALPNLTRLFADCLVLHVDDAGAPTTQQREQHCLKHVTEFGAAEVHVHGGHASHGEADAAAAAAVAAALPALTTVTQLPCVLQLPLGRPSRVNAAIGGAGCAFSRCPRLSAVRAYGDVTAMHGLPADVFGQLGGLRQLVLYGVGPAEELKGISRLTQLSSLSVAFACGGARGSCHVAHVLRELAAMTRHLRRLALPARLLCAACCGGAVMKEVAALATACQSCDAGGSTGSGLQLLCFMQRPAQAAAKGAARGPQRRLGDYCRHAQLPALLSAVQQGGMAAVHAALLAGCAAVGEAAADAMVEAAARSVRGDGRGGVRVRVVVLPAVVERAMGITDAVAVHHHHTQQQGAEDGWW